jgi:hypothetical protein
MNVYDVDVNIDGYVFVPDFGNDRVQIFSSDLELVGTINGIDNAISLDTDGTGRLYVLSQGDDNVTVWHTNDLGDHLGPAISDVTTDPLNPYSDQPVTVSAMITDMSGIRNATLTYTHPGANMTTVILGHIGDTYSTVLSGFPPNVTISFYIWAEDNSLTRHTTNGSVHQFNVNYPGVPLTPYTPAFGIDPALLGLGAIGVGVIALILVFIRKPK